MELILKYKNIPEYGQSKCKFNDIYDIELDEQKCKIILTRRKNNEQTVIYYDSGDDISITITRKRK